MSSIIVNSDANPHLSQYEGKSVDRHLSYDDSDRRIHKNDKTMEYSESKQPRSAMHWGQRKLLISEIEFLTKYEKDATTLIYVGAGSKAQRGISLGGIHIAYLSRMFPNINFHLYDPTDFGVAPTSHIHLYKQLFTDEDAVEWKDKNIPLLFVSDIRTVGDDEPDKYKYATAILSDMNNQLNWTQIMSPKASMVKFKLPYGDVKKVSTTTKYPIGDNYLPIWGRPTTTETRLIYTNPNDLMNYDNLLHEERMSSFNNITLLSYYDHDYEGKFKIEGFDHCY